MAAMRFGSVQCPPDLVPVCPVRAGSGSRRYVPSGPTRAAAVPVRSAWSSRFGRPRSKRSRFAGFDSVRGHRERKKRKREGRKRKKVLIPTTTKPATRTYRYLKLCTCCLFCLPAAHQGPRCMARSANAALHTYI